MDNNAQEKERGITILAKNAAIMYKGVKMNLIDTPGHAGKLFSFVLISFLSLFLLNHPHIYWPFMLTTNQTLEGKSSGS